MCCIFTCLGWMIDLVQRFWSFAMSCCISSAVCCLLIIASMAGIALGYNYSLAEYIDLKESNVSIFLKRGIFDDEISDLQLRRANEHGFMRSGSEKPADLRSGDEESTTLRSGRRLDDSVFESGDQNKYEGSLMKLTARPPYEHSTKPHITEDTDMQLAIGSFTKDSLDALKAVQSVIDSRRAYAQTIRGPTMSPVPTIKEFALYNDDNMRQRGVLPARRRMMLDANFATPSLSPARLAVPDPNIGDAANWIAPLKNFVVNAPSFQNYGLEHESTTFPSSIPFKPGPIRPTPTTPSRGLFLTKFTPITLFSTRPTYETEMTAFTQNPKELSFKEKLMAENDRPLRKHRPKSDEEYEYDIKGLPVRKRRSINLEDLTNTNDSYMVPYKHNEKITQAIKNSNSKEPTHDIILTKNILLDLLDNNEDFVSYKTDINHNVMLNISNNSDKENNSKIYIETTRQLQENKTINHDSTTKSVLNRSINATKYKNLFTHITTNLQLIKKRLFESFLYTKVSAAINDNDDIPIRETLFINKIVSSENNNNVNSTENNILKNEKPSSRNSSKVEQPLLTVNSSYTGT